MHLTYEYLKSLTYVQMLRLLRTTNPKHREQIKIIMRKFGRKIKNND